MIEPSHIAHQQKTDRRISELMRTRGMTADIANEYNILSSVRYQCTPSDTIRKQQLEAQYPIRQTATKPTAPPRAETPISNPIAPPPKKNEESDDMDQKQQAAEFSKLVAQHQINGRSRDDVVRRMAIANPTLHQAWVAQHQTTGPKATTTQEQLIDSKVGRQHRLMTGRGRKRTPAQLAAIEAYSGAVNTYLVANPNATQSQARRAVSSRNQTLHENYLAAMQN